MPHSTIPVFESIMRILTAHLPQTIGIYVFGSQADGTARKDSDFDIAFLTSAPAHLDPVALFDLANTLASALSTDVHLVDILEVSLDLRFEIITKGKRFYCADRYACDTFEMISISMYQRFEEERKPVVEAFKQRLASWQTGDPCKNREYSTMH